MLFYYHAVRETAHRIADAADHTVGALREGQVEQEPAMTDRMLGAIAESLRNFTVKGIRWQSKTLTDHGPGTQESRFGADFMGVLNINLPEFSVSKGFLAQAKLIKRGRVNDLRALRHQCDQMLSFTPDSFVFLYGYYGIRVVPALSVISATTDPTFLYSRSTQRFFEEHLECFIGDQAIQSATPMGLEVLRRRFEVRSALLLQAEPEDLEEGLAGMMIE